MVWGQDLDTRVQLNWEQLPVSRIPDAKSRKAEVLNALELLFGEQLFEDE